MCSDGNHLTATPVRGGWSRRKNPRATITVTANQSAAMVERLTTLVTYRDALETRGHQSG